MTQKANINEDLENSIQHLLEVFSKEFSMQPTMTDLVGFMLAKEVSLLTLSLDRIEARLNELVEPLKMNHPSATQH